MREDIGSDVADFAEAEKAAEELRKPMTESEAFRNWGCQNSLSEEEMERYNRAYAMHKAAELLDPEHHHLVETEIGRCYYDVSCKCGFHSTYDCSD